MGSPQVEAAQDSELNRSGLGPPNLHYKAPRNSPWVVPRPHLGWELRGCMAVGKGLAPLCAQ